MSNCTVICWTPAPSVTGTFTVVQVCHAPVFGTFTVDQTELDELGLTLDDPHQPESE